LGEVPCQRELSGLNGNVPQAASPVVIFLFVDSFSLAGLYSFVTVGFLQGCKQSHITGPQLMRGVRGEAAQDDIVSKRVL